VGTQDGTGSLFTVLRRGRHVMVVTGADPGGTLAGPALEPYRDLFEVVTHSPGDARAFRGGPVFLVRPDGYIAARGRPDRLETVLGYLRELSGETGISRPGRPAGRCQWSSEHSPQRRSLTAPPGPYSWSAGSSSVAWSGT